MKFSTLRTVIAFCSCFALYLSGCKPSDNSIYYYNKDEDVIAPEIKISVPIANDLFQLTEDVHIVGTATDLETPIKAGSLRSLQIKVDQIDPTNSNTVIKGLLLKTPNVDGKDGYTFNEKFVVNFASSTVYCRLIVTAFDQTDRFDIDSVFFAIN
jgi:hypothetical protein